MPCGTVRQRLYVDGQETAFFVDVASQIQHRSAGQKVGLWGSGMGNEVRRRDGSTYRIAGLLSAFDKVTPAKHRAEQMALS